MGTAIRLFENRRKARKTFSGIMDNQEHILVIHYSCESFYDRTDGTSPRITSIAVRNYYTGQTKSFSIHQFAEIRKKLGSIEENYNELENQMLDSFYSFVNQHLNFKWFHWNMRDISFGFEALNHRYTVLGGTPIDIPESNRIDLSIMLINLFGENYINHPRLINIINLNNITAKDLIAGQEEALAFTNKEYIKLHFSTLRKVNAIADIAEKVHRGELKTNIKWIESFKYIPQAIGEWFKENAIVSLVLGIVTIIGAIVGIIQLFK